MCDADGRGWIFGGFVVARITAGEIAGDFGGNRGGFGFDENIEHVARRSFDLRQRRNGNARDDRRNLAALLDPVG